ncbi:MAG: virulence factor family protein [Nevskia sp.]
MNPSIRIAVLAAAALSLSFRAFADDAAAPAPAAATAPAVKAARPKAPAKAVKPKAVAAKAEGAAPAVPGKDETLSHGRFRDVTIYRPEGTPKSFVMFLSGDGGWNLGVVSMAKTLVAKGALVAGINTPKLLAEMEKDGADCVYPDGDLENLSHFIQAYYKLPTYLAPLIVGYSSGATLAYASLVQAPEDTFAGALTLGFCPDLNLHKPLCKGSGIEFAKRSDGTGVDFLAAKKLGDPWITLHGAIDQVCDVPATRAFVAKVPKAEFVELPKVGHGFSVPTNWEAQYEAAFAKLTSVTSPKTVPPPPASLSGLPVIEIPAKAGAPTSDVFALLISGDGGWAGIDKEVAASLSAKGIPVVGIDSLRYFWTPRTPEVLAADVEKILRYYLSAWKKSRALFIGYSQGADVLPFALSRLSPATRAQVAEAAVMGLSDDALFEFHLASWVGAADEGLPTRPEIARLKNVIGGMPLLCIYGEDDGEALCPKLDAAQVRIVKLKGGHHFGGDYDRVAQEIINGIPPSTH